MLTTFIDDSKLNFGKIEIDLQMYQVHGTDSNNEEVHYLVIEKLRKEAIQL